MDSRSEKARIILITGGARSGKSRYAEARARELGRRLLYLATAEPGDAEMERRIAEHRSRRGPEWVTVEQAMHLTAELPKQRGKVDCAVIDCLTLWVSNLLIRGGERLVETSVAGLLELLPHVGFHVVLVSNEVGWGIVPENPLARQFRDLAGWVNQRIAEAADEVVLMIAGLPVRAKGSVS